VDPKCLGCERVEKGRTKAGNSDTSDGEDAKVELGLAMNVIEQGLEARRDVV